ncbi:F-box only protein 6 isoform X2 [Cajanus cajan]|uniref:F-box only protein 6 isoform X2 n=1 Tax=Cajanus cajan TaxID=3821 RepID=UPI0010FB591E|nr:F-box only protein 6 isoform X2 [Cajanus cajan]
MNICDHPFHRRSFFDIDDYSVDDFYSLVMAAGKSGSFRMAEPLKHPSKKFRRDRSRGKSSGRSSRDEAMEQQIWKDLPEDLFEPVIARLPFATFFRFRSVCQRWNSLLTSQSFSQHCAQVPRANPWFYISHEHANSGSMYDPSMKKWYHPTISTLPAKLMVLLLPVASAGGLVCFLDIYHQNLYVCNPLTQSLKELPTQSVRLWSRAAVGMTVNGNSTGTGYKILLVGCDAEYQIYDSVTKSWSHPGNMPADIKLPLSLYFRSQAISIDSTLYFMHSDPEGIVSYDMATGVWTQYIIPAPSDLTDRTLAECDGRILLVGLLTKNAATCICIWELQKMTFLWKEVDRMPNVWCLDFYGKHVRMTCLGNKGLLMLSLRSRQMNRLVTYNIASREWVKVPSCVVPHGGKRQWITHGTAFYPCLTIMA